MQLTRRVSVPKQSPMGGAAVRSSVGWSHHGRPRPSARLLRPTLAVWTLLLAACTNYEFRPGSGGSLDLSTLVEALEARQPNEPHYLQEALWIPLIYRSVTRFQRTEKTLEPDFPVGGYTLARERRVGPLGVFWATSAVQHHDAEQKLYHSSSRWGVGRRLVGEVSIRVRAEEGAFEFRQGELLFGLLKAERQGYPAPLVLSFPPTAESPPATGIEAPVP